MKVKPPTSTKTASTTKKPTTKVSASPTGKKTIKGAKKVARPGVGSSADAVGEVAPLPVDLALVEAERLARLELEELDREAARQKEWEANQAQRAEIADAIVAEERRVRQREKKKRERLAAEKKQQEARRGATSCNDLAII